MRFTPSLFPSLSIRNPSISKLKNIKDLKIQNEQFSLKSIRIQQVITTISNKPILRYYELYLNLFFLVSIPYTSTPKVQKNIQQTKALNKDMWVHIHTFCTERKKCLFKQPEIFIVSCIITLSYLKHQKKKTTNETK